MKFLSKINRGLILTVIIVTGIAFYLVNQSITLANSKPQIKEVCKEYIETAIKYEQLPENYRKESPVISEEELNKHINDMTNTFKNFYSENEQSYKYVIDIYKENLKNQADGKEVVFSYNKEINDFQYFEFDGNKVTVTINTKSELDRQNVEREKITGQTIDTITLEKTDGKWKVVYAYLQEPVKKQNNYNI